MKQISFAILCGLFLGVSGFADVLGSSPVQRTETDACTGCLFAYAVVPVGDTNEALTSWDFYADVNPTAPRPGGNLITPVLFSSTGTVLGIGATQTVTTPGLQSYSFDLQSGSNIVQAGDLIGWRDGGTAAGSGNNGTISLDLGGGHGIDYYICVGSDCSFNGSIAVTETFALENANTTSRSYSAQFTLTPEPAFYGVLALGLSGMVLALVRRRRQA